MIHTALSHLTDYELIRSVDTKSDSTMHEIELAKRLDCALAFIDDLLDEVNNIRCDLVHRPACILDAYS